MGVSRAVPLILVRDRGSLGALCAPEFLFFGRGFHKCIGLPQWQIDAEGRAAPFLAGNGNRPVMNRSRWTAQWQDRGRCQAVS